MPQKPPKLTKKALRKPKINIKHKNNTPQIYIFIPETFLKNSKIQKTPYLKKKAHKPPKKSKKALKEVTNLHFQPKMLDISHQMNPRYGLKMNHHQVSRHLLKSLNSKWRYLF